MSDCYNRTLFLCDDCQFEETAIMCAEQGFGIEVQSFYDPAYARAHPEAIGQHERGLTRIPPVLRSFHGPFGDLCPGNSDEGIREATRLRMDEATTVAGELGINRVILHNGYVPGTSSLTGYVERSAAFWRSFLCDKPLDLQVYIENWHESDPGMLIDVLAAVDDPLLSICLDIGHIHCRSKVPVVEWIRVLGPRIGYVHLHDNHGDADSHLPLGEGTISLAKVCETLNERAPSAVWALEAGRSGFAKSLNWLERNGFR